MNNIRNIYCIGRNYAKHATELGNEMPEEPILFSKPTHALAKADGQLLSFPSGKGEIHYELELVLRINREVRKGDKLEEIVGQMALGVDMTLRDVQSLMKKKGYPWLRAKGFRNSAIITEFWDFPGLEECKKQTFSLSKNNEVAQEGNIQEMMYDFQAIIEECEEAFGLGEGDIIFTGTPEGVGPIKDEDVFELFWGQDKKGSFQVSL